MVEKSSKNNFPNRCKFCGWKFPNELVERINKNSDFLFCELCGAEVRYNNVKNQENDETIESKSDNDPGGSIDKSKSSPWKRFYETIKNFIIENEEGEIQEGLTKKQREQIFRVYKNPDFPQIFKSNFIIVFARITYFELKKLKSTAHLRNSKRNLTKAELKTLTERLSPIAKKDIKVEFLKDLHKISQNDFKKRLKRLQVKLKSSSTYYHDFITYIQWLITIIAKIVSELWDNTNLPKFEQTILEDLKNYFYTKNNIKNDPEENLTDNILKDDFRKNNFGKFCHVVVEYIKKRIGISNNRFDEYYIHIKEKGLNNEEILEDVLSDDTLTRFLKISNIDAQIDDRYISSKNRNKTKRIIQIIALLLLKCPNYHCVVDNLSRIGISSKTKQKLSKQMARKSVRNFLNKFQKLYPQVDLQKWLPKPKEKYTLEYIKNLVKVVSIERIGVEGELIEPETAQKFKALKNKLSLKPGSVPLKVKCRKCGGVLKTMGKYLERGDWPCKLCLGYIYSYKMLKSAVKMVSIEKTSIEGKLLWPSNENDWIKYIYNPNRKSKPSRIRLTVQCGSCGNIWHPEARAVVQERQWCKICSWNVLTYEKLVFLVESVGLNKTGVKGILIRPENENKFNELLNNARNIIESLNISKNNPRYKGLQPKRLGIQVKCGFCKNPFSTNAERLIANKFCPRCSSGEYEQIICWYASKIFSYITKSKLIFPKVQLSKVINSFDKNRYSQEELNAIENLIRKGGGHIDGYEKFTLEYSWLKLGIEYQGEYHYKVKKYLNMTDIDLEYRKLLDYLTKDLSEQNEIILLIFPYYVDPYMRHPKKIQKFIINEFERLTNIDIKKYNIPLFDHRTPEFGQYRLDNYLK